MKKLLVVLIVLFSVAIQAQNKNLVVIGKIDSIQSTILNEERKILVYNPGGPTSKEIFPVVYVLDGDAHFNSVVGMIEQLSVVNGNTVCPKMIVVGIPNTNRWRDLTPSHVEPDLPILSTDAAKDSGGGENFLLFIEKELIPYIDANYPTSGYRMLIGHSLGGLTAMNAMINHTTMFRSYVAIDPSMWFDNKKLLLKTEKVLEERSFADTSLYLAIANTIEQKGLDTLSVQKDTSKNSEHIRAILELSRHIDHSKKKNGLAVKWKYYADDNHGSVPLIATYDALHFFFKQFRLDLELVDYTDVSINLQEKLKIHYEKVSKLFGYKVSPPEDLVNNAGYQILALKQYDKAERLFIMNTTNFPESSNAFDSLGDLYEAKGDKPKAIANFKKALALKEVPDTRRKLEALTGKRKK